MLKVFALDVAEKHMELLMCELETLTKVKTR